MRIWSCIISNNKYYYYYYYYYYCYYIIIKFYPLWYKLWPKHLVEDYSNTCTLYWRLQIQTCPYIVGTFWLYQQSWNFVTLSTKMVAKCITNSLGTKVNTSNGAQRNNIPRLNGYQDLALSSTWLFKISSVWIRSLSAHDIQDENKHWSLFALYVCSA